MQSSTSSGRPVASDGSTRHPRSASFDACSRWLEGELTALSPALVVCLGATPARAILGRDARVGALRGRVIERESIPSVVVTVHPSYVLRLVAAEREAAFREFVRDLNLAVSYLSRG